MRRFFILTFLALVQLSAGCEWLKSLRKSDDERPVNTTGRLQEKPARDFVTYLNRQADYVETVRYDSVSLKATVPNQSYIPALRSGMLVCQKPRNFRMQAGMMVGGDQIDIGSNPQELWMYMKQPKPSYSFCSHSDFPKVQESLPVPFEPDWVLQALGMTKYDPNLNYQIEVSDRNKVYRLSYEDRTALGQPVKRVTEFSGEPTRGDAPQVRRHLMMTKDQSGQWQVTTSAEIRKVKTMDVTDPTTGVKTTVQIPTLVVLEWPVQKVKMELDLGSVKLNQREEPALFTKPNRIDNVTPVNMADYRMPGFRDLPGK